MLLYNPKLNGLVHSLDYINFIRVQATHLAVTEDGSLVRSHARVLDLRHEALELRPGLLVLGEAGQRPFHPSAWGRPGQAIIYFLPSSTDLFLIIFLLSTLEKSKSREIIGINKCCYCFIKIPKSYNLFCVLFLSICCIIEICIR